MQLLNERIQRKADSGPIFWDTLHVTLRSHSSNDTTVVTCTANWWPTVARWQIHEGYTFVCVCVSRILRKMKWRTNTRRHFSREMSLSKDYRVLAAELGGEKQLISNSLYCQTGEILYVLLVLSLKYNRSWTQYIR